MKYVIGEMLTEHIKQTGTSYRRYAIERDVNNQDLTLVRMGHRGASPMFLSKLIDLEILRAAVLNEIKENIDDLNTENLISVYNSIYKRMREQGETSQDKV